MLEFKGHAIPLLQDNSFSRHAYVSSFGIEWRRARSVSCSPTAARPVRLAFPSSGVRMENNRLYFRTFILLLALVTLAFIWLLQPYLTAIFWGAVLAIIFMPAHKRLLAA